MPDRRQTIAVKGMDIPGMIKCVAESGEVVLFASSAWPGGLPAVNTVWEWDGSHFVPSAVTWDQWCDRLPTPRLRAMYRYRLCLTCFFTVDLCLCGCCPEAET